MTDKDKLNEDELKNEGQNKDISDEEECGEEFKEQGLSRLRECVVYYWTA